MKSKNIDVLVKILYAVETGGQVYGKQRYDAFIGANHNTSNETAITIGAGQWYANEAKVLLKKILSKYPIVFRKFDNVGVEHDLSRDWGHYSIHVSSDKTKVIVAIISSSEGIICQDELMREQIKSYSETIQAKYGNMSDTAVMECINIIHQGGQGALKRVLKKTKKPYTVDSIYSALCTDVDDKSNNNQVGDYVSRQKKVYSFIKQYAEGEEEEIMGCTAEQYLNVWRSWLGFSEANGKFKIIIDLYNSMRPLPRGYAVQYKDEWCDTTVSAAAIKAGCTDLVGRECGCEEHVKIFKQKGIWIEDGTITPQFADIIVYNWDDSTQPNDGHSDHIGVVESVSNGKITVIEGNKGEAVGRRVLSVGNGYIRGFARPKWTKAASTPVKPAPAPTSGDIERTVKWNGYINNDVKTRTWAGTENKQLVSYPVVTKGSMVGVCDSINDKDGDPWYFVKISGNKGDKYGFVPASFVGRTKPGSSIELKDDGKIDKTPKKVGKVIANVLNVRTWAGTEYKKIKSWPQLRYGNLIDICDLVLDKDGDPWYYVRIDSRFYGFVSAVYVEF